MKRSMQPGVLLLLGLAALFSGCWGDNKTTSLGLTPASTSFATVGVDVCLNCHPTQSSQWLSSRHSNLNYSPEYPADTSCNPCHNPLSDGALLSGTWGDVRNVIGCETCHGGGGEHFGLGPINSPTVGVYAVAATDCASSQYNTCTQCHPDTVAGNEHGDAERAITDTHFENAAKTAWGTIQGYIIRKTKNTACTDCHNPHTTGLTENRQWKASRHGNFESLAWAERGIIYTGNDLAYNQCQRCHTSTGFVRYSDNHAATLDNSFFFADGYTTNTNRQAQVLYCWACHRVSSTGFVSGRRAVEDARIPGAWDNGQVFYSSTTNLNSYTTIPNKGDSQICMNCHSSRPGRNGFFVRPYLDAQTGGVDNTYYGGPTPHYLIGDQTIFQDNTRGIGAYALPGRVYTNDPDFMHSSVGGSTSGPCVGCHMGSPNSTTDETIGKHSFLPVTKVDNVITAITSTKCAECHDGTTTAVITVASLNALKTQYFARLAEFRAALEDNSVRAGIFPNANGNRFYNSASAAVTNSSTSTARINNWQTRAAAIAPAGGYAQLTGYDVFGICLNFNYLNYAVAEPGAWAHNPKYANRLIYDAIQALGRVPSFSRP